MSTVSEEGILGKKDNTLKYTDILLAPLLVLFCCLAAKKVKKIFEIMEQTLKIAQSNCTTIIFCSISCFCKQMHPWLLTLHGWKSPFTAVGRGNKGRYHWVHPPYCAENLLTVKENFSPHFFQTLKALRLTRWTGPPGIWQICQIASLCLGTVMFYLTGWFGFGIFRFLWLLLVEEVISFNHSLDLTSIVLMTASTR